MRQPGLREPEHAASESASEVRENLGETTAAFGKGVGCAMYWRSARCFDRAMSPKSLTDAFSRVRAAARHLREVEEGTFYGTPALKVRGKLIARLKDSATLVVRSTQEEKEMLMEVKPAIYHET